MLTILKLWMSNNKQKMDIDNHQQFMDAIPRLNGQMLQNKKYTGVKISIVGKYLRTNTNDTTIQEFQASDEYNFNVVLGTNSNWNGYKTKYIEIRGIVNKNGSVTQISCQEYGDNFPMKTWDKFVRLTHQYPALF